MGGGAPQKFIHLALSADCEPTTQKNSTAINRCCCCPTFGYTELYSYFAKALGSGSLVLIPYKILAFYWDDPWECGSSDKPSGWHIIHGWLCNHSRCMETSAGFTDGIHESIMLHGIGKVTQLYKVLHRAIPTEEKYSFASSVYVQICGEYLGSVS